MARCDATHIINLRALEYLFDNHEEQYLEQYIATGIINRLGDDSHTREMLKYQRLIDHQETKALSAIETQKGVLIFGRDGWGMECRQAYLQYLADHYFDPDHKDITSLETRVIRGCTPQLHAQGVESRRMFNRGGFFLIPERIAYRQCTLEGEPPAQEMHRLPLGHNSKDFGNFIDRYNLSISDRNIDICALLSIAESGSARSVRNSAAHMLKESFGVEISMPESKKQHKPSLH